MLKILLTIFFSWIFLAGYTEDISIYVSPQGRGNGSAQSPTTLQKAIAMLPDLKKVNLKGTITIFFNDGNYNLDQPIKITPQNGGTKDLQILFKALLNKHPVVSGGQKIILTGNKILSAKVRDDGGKPYDLYVNGKRAVRARTPNIDHYFSLDKTVNVPDSNVPLRFTLQLEMPPALSDQLAVLPKEDLHKVWFNIYYKWDNTMRTIDSLNKDKTSFYSTGNLQGEWALTKKPGLFYIENYPAALDTANEWMLQVGS